MRTIKLHGALAERFGSSIQLDAANMFQVMAGLESRFGPEFREAIRVGRWHVFDGEQKAGNDLSEEELDRRRLKNKTLHIVPVVAGSDAAVRVIVGIALIAIGAYTGQTWMIQAGIALAVGGIAEMLMRPAAMDQNQKLDQAQSSLFNQARNVTTQGGPIPLIYGRVRRASSVVISSDFSTTAVIVPQVVVDFGGEGIIP